MKTRVLKDKQFIMLEQLVSYLKYENKFQVTKWGVQKHTPFEWLTYTTEELGELAKSISEYEYRDGSISDIVKEAIQTATLSLKIAEMYLYERETDNIKTKT